MERAARYPLQLLSAKPPVDVTGIILEINKQYF
jgi:hypothetical protein